MNVCPRWICAAVILSASNGFAADFVPPQPQPAERYGKMVEDWPFALATAAAPVTEATPGFATNLYVMGISREHYADGDDRDVVMIKSKADQTSFRLVGTEPNKEGISVSSIDWKAKVGESKVTLKKGSEFAPVQFDQANLHSSAPMPATAPGLRLPSAPNIPRPIVAPTTSLPLQNNGTANNANTINGPRNQGRILPVIPHPNAIAPVANQPQPGVLPKAVPGANGQVPLNDSRRRVRVINSRP